MTDAAIDPNELRVSIREVLEAEAPSDHVHKVYNAGDAIDGKLASVAAQLGWYALGVDEALGGLGLGVAGLAVVYEELGRVPASLPMLPSMIVAQAIAASGSEALQTQWLGRLIAGEVHAAWLPDSAGSFSDGTISGSVSHVLDGTAADVFLLGVGHQAVIVAADAPGLSMTSKPLVDRTRTMASIIFDQTPATLIACDRRALDRHAYIGIASDCVGGADSILGRTIEYMKVRTQFGQAIGSFQALKHRVSNHKLRLELSRGLLAEAVRADLADANAVALAALAKATAADAYAAIADDAVQLHGGIGFTWEQDCHIFLKRARLNQQLFGTSEQLLDNAANVMMAAAL